MIVNHEAAQSALYHIEAIERRAKLLRQYINPQAGAIHDTDVVCGLVNAIDAELVDLRDDLIRFL